MKTTFLKLLSLSFLFLFVFGMIVSPLAAIAQDAEKEAEKDAKQEKKLDKQRKAFQKKNAMINIARFFI